MILMNNKDIEFVARHYRRGRFSPTAGWRRLGLGHGRLAARFRVAAAIAVAVILTATAAVVYHEYGYSADTREPAVSSVASPLVEVRVIDFEDAPLQQVVEKIEAVYSVKVCNVPEDADHLSLSLHYEGNPSDLVEEINEILGTEMTVTEK